MVDGVGLLVAVVCLAFVSVTFSLAIVLSLLRPRQLSDPDPDPSRSHQHRSTSLASALRDAHLLPAQRLQLLLAGLDIVIVVLFTASLHSVILGTRPVTATPLLNGPVTAAISLGLLIRPALICAFACNSFASIWMDRSIASERKLFLPACAVSLLTSGLCAVLVRFDGAATDESKLTKGQAAASAWLISCNSLLAIVGTLALGGIISAVWMSRKQFGANARTVPERRLTPIHPASSRSRPIASRKNAGKPAEFGVRAAASVNTFGPSRPGGSLDTGQRIDHALDGTLRFSERTATTNDDSRRAAKSAAASSLHPYDPWPTLSTRSNGQAAVLPGSAGKSFDSRSEPPGQTSPGDFSIPHVYDHDFDGTFTSDPSVSPGRPDASPSSASQGIRAGATSPDPSPGPSRGFQVISRQPPLRRRESTTLLSRVRSTGFVLLDSDQIRQATATQCFDLPRTPQAAWPTVEADQDVEKNTVHSSLASASLSRVEALKALARLAGLIFSVWLPFSLSLPYLTNGWLEGKDTSGRHTRLLLLLLAFTSTSPLTILQFYITRRAESGHRRNRTPQNPSSLASGPFGIHAKKSSDAELPVAGVGYGHCNGYDHGLLSPSEGSRRKTPRQDSLQTPTPARFSSAETFGPIRSPQADANSRGVASVPFAAKHWSGRQVSEDRVEPRGAVWRAVNLMWSPRPTLDVLPPHDGRAACRGATLPASAIQTPPGDVVRSHPTSVRGGTDTDPGTLAMSPSASEAAAPRASDSSPLQTQDSISYADDSAVRAEQRRQTVLLEELNGLLSLSRQESCFDPSGWPVASVISAQATEHAMPSAPTTTAAHSIERSSERSNRIEPPPQERREPEGVDADESLPSCYIKDFTQAKEEVDSVSENDLVRSSTLHRRRTPCRSSRHLSLDEQLEEIPLTSDVDSPGQSRHRQKSLSTSSIFVPSPSCSSRKSYQNSPCRGSPTFSLSNSPIGHLFSQASDALSRKHRRSSIADISNSELPAYTILEDTSCNDLPAVEPEHCSDRADRAALFRGSIDRRAKSVQEEVCDELGQKPDRNASGGSVSEGSQFSKSRTTLAKTLGLNSLKRKSAPARKASLGEAMGLEPVTKRPLSTELGLEMLKDAVAIGTKGHRDRAVQPEEAHSVGKGMTSPDTSSSSSHRRQDTLGSISILSSCLSEEIVISPDPSPEKSRQVELVGHEFVEPAHYVPPSQRGPLETVQEEAETAEEAIAEAPIRPRELLTIFREQYPVRILSPVWELTEDGISLSNASIRDRRPASLLSVSPASISRRSIAVVTATSSPAATPSKAVGLKRSFSQGSPSPSKQTRPVSAHSLQRRLLQQVARSPERSLTQMLRDKEEMAELNSLFRTMSLSPCRKSQASRRLSELSFDESIWSRSPPSLALSTNLGLDRAIADASPARSRILPAASEAVSPSPPLRNVKTKRRSTSSLQLLASSGASAVSAWKDLRMRTADRDATRPSAPPSLLSSERRKSVLSTPLADLRSRLKKLERRSSLLKSHGGSTARPGAVGPKKPKKPRGRVAVLTDRHHFTVVDADDSFVNIVPGHSKSP